MTLSSAAITTQLGEQGLGQQPWWVEQWMELINGYRFKKRLERAWAYAREGNVLSIRFEGRRVHARVQGSGEEPYKLKIWLDVLSDDDWRYVLEALGQKARWSAQLLAGVMPQDIERAFAASGRRLFPFKLQEVRSECTCLDNRNGKGNLCKHISAVYYLMGKRFSEDPFVLFQLRGRSRAQLLSDLAEQRRLLLARKAQEARVAIEATPPAEGEPAQDARRAARDVERAEASGGVGDEARAVVGLGGREVHRAAGLVVDADGVGRRRPIERVVVRHVAADVHDRGARGRAEGERRAGGGGAVARERAGERHRAARH